MALRTVCSLEQLLSTECEANIPTNVRQWYGNNIYHWIVWISSINFSYKSFHSLMSRIPFIYRLFICLFSTCIYAFFQTLKKPNNMTAIQNSPCPFNSVIDTNTYLRNSHACQNILSNIYESTQTQYIHVNTFDSVGIKCGCKLCTYDRYLVCAHMHW